MAASSPNDSTIQRFNDSTLENLFYQHGACRETYNLRGGISPLNGSSLQSSVVFAHPAKKSFHSALEFPVSADPNHGLAR
jgi:hypothetical protein